MAPDPSSSAASSLATAAFRLSAQQERAWLEHERGAQQFAQCAIVLEGPLDVARLKEALQQAVSKYEILRTGLRRQTGIKLPFQVIREEAAFHFEQAPGDKSDIEDLLLRERDSLLNAEGDHTPRALLVASGAGGYKLALTVPVFCADHETLKNLFREIAAGYGGESEPVPDGVMQYADLVEWQNELLASEETKAGRDFWRSSCRNIDFAALQSCALPLETKDDKQFSFASTVVAIPELSKRVVTFASQIETSPEVVLLGAWNALLSRLTDVPDTTTGCEFDGRRYEELSSALGPLARSLPIRMELSAEIGFSDFLRKVEAATAEARNWQESFAWGQASEVENPFLPFSFAYHDLGDEKIHGGVGFSLERVEVVSERFKLRLVGVRRESELELEFHYDASRLERRAVERIAGYYQNLLAAAVANPETAVSRLPLLSGNERRQLLVEWNQTATAYPEQQTVHELFEQQAARVPEREAVRGGEQALSYRELNERSNQLAHYLRRQGVGADRPVGLCLERSAETMVAVLAILKAGGAYVPLNPDNPPARLQQQLQGAAAVITEAKLAAQMPEFAGPTIVLDGEQKLWAKEAKSNPAPNTTPDNLVYVIYTSGSTGVPKGVAVRHRNLVNYADFITKRLELEKYPEGLQFATVSTLGADLGNTCIYPGLISGGTVHIVGYEMATDPRRFAEYVAKHPIDVLKIVPSHLQALVHSEDAAKLLPRKYLIFGGETLTPKLVEKIAALQPGCEMLNHYGPTETTVGSLTLKLQDKDKDYDWKKAKLASIPIGRPIQNTQLYILDANLELVPIGVTGELYIAGAGVTAGYLGQAEKTAERFVKNPFASGSEVEATMYRTGDLARYGTDGNVEFLGRGDDQVKIRGFRIELGEIEAVLARHGGVKQAVVLAREDAQGEKRLLAYVVASRESSSSGGPVTGPLAGEDLRAYLKQHVPDYMVPQAVVVLAKLPLNANGKIDRQALPEPEQAPAAREIIGPRNEIEQALLKVWQRVLNKQQVGVTDNFFELGGHSLMAVQLMGEIKKDIGKEIPLASLFQGATIEYLAHLLEGEESVDKSILREIQPGGTLPPFFAGVLPGVNALGYLNLSKHMGPDQPFYMLQGSGPGPRAARRPYTAQEYEKVASEYIRAMRAVQPEGPYHIGGMCEGARIVFEMARLLEAQGQKVNLLAIFDTWALENTQNPHLWRIYYYSRRVQEMRRLSWASRMNIFRQALRSRLGWWLGSKSAPPKSEWMETYWPGEDFVPSQVHSRITVFKVPKQPFYYYGDPLLGWGGRTISGVETHIIPNGKHRFVLREPYVRYLATTLARALQELHSKNGNMPEVQKQRRPVEVAVMR
jgi:amino acid adenylation domain-containing protein